MAKRMCSGRWFMAYRNLLRPLQIDRNTLRLALTRDALNMDAREGHAGWIVKLGRGRACECVRLVVLYFVRVCGASQVYIAN